MHSIVNSKIASGIPFYVFQKKKLYSFKLCYAVLIGFGSGLVVAKIGPRKVGVVGGCLSALGLCLSFLATDIPYLVITIGVITGTCI